jgi:tRNA dimethylallyltransferase
MTDAVLIAGPTAGGKSAAALALAGRIGGTIVNTDSMQVYRELHVLTARPSPDDEARAPHALYGHVPVTERYSAGRYQDDAARAVAEARAVGRVPIFAGGTGLYFEVLEKGLSPIPPVPAAVRAANRERLETIGSDAFYATFAECDPETAGALRPADTQRVLRAADVFEATGWPLARWQKEKGKPVLEGLDLMRVVIAPAREELYARIDRRFDAMIANGALEEVRPLAGLDPTLPAARALGVRQLLRHLAGEITLEEAAEDVKRETRRYAKRQLTWFRNRMPDWRWTEVPLNFFPLRGSSP